MVDQFCRLNRFKWYMHGDFLRMLLKGGKTPITTTVFGQQLDFVIIGSGASPIETIATNLHVSGFQVVTSTASEARLIGNFASNSRTHVSIPVLLQNKFPFSFFTTDAIVLDANGMSVRSTSPSADTINTNKGIALLDRLMILEEDIVRPETVVLATNDFECHKEHNASFLEQVVRVSEMGFKLKGSNMDVFVSVGDDCPICMTSGQLSTSLKCGHTMCLACICKVLKTERTPRCCLCRDNLTFVTTQLPSGVVL